MNGRQSVVYSRFLLFLLPIERVVVGSTCDFNGWLTTGSKYLFIFCAKSGEKRVFFLLIKLHLEVCQCLYSLFFFVRVRGCKGRGDGIQCARAKFGCALFLDALVSRTKRSISCQWAVNHANNAACTVPLRLGGPRILFTTP